MLAEPWFIVLLSFILSVNSYTFVENKTRFLKQKPVFFILLVLMLSIGVVSLVAFKNHELVQSEINIEGV